MSEFRKNKPHRTKEQMADDVAFILAAPVSYGAKFSVLKDVCWAWTEFDGKYKGCHLWSKGAVLQYADDPKTKRLRHEHAVPRRVIIEMLCELERPSPETVKGICDKFLVGVIVIKEEDAVLNCEFSKKMSEEFFEPSGPEYHDPLLRYKRCGVEVLQRCWEN